MRFSQAPAPVPSTTRSPPTRALLTMAEAMGETKVASLLTENLQQEQEALRKLQVIGKRLAQEGAKASTS